jgi:hypothetical protein
MKEATLKEIAEKLGIYYHRHRFPRKFQYVNSLKTKNQTFAFTNYSRIKTIGLIIPEIVHHFFSMWSMALLVRPKKWLFGYHSSIWIIRTRKKQVALLINKELMEYLFLSTNQTWQPSQKKL